MIYTSSQPLLVSVVLNDGLVSSATMYGPFEVQDSGDVKVYFFGLHDGEEGHLNCVLYFGEECKSSGSM